MIVVIGPPLAHDVGPERTVGHLGGHVDGARLALNGVEVFGEALPLPFDALGKGCAGDVLHAFHQADEPFL